MPSLADTLVIRLMDVADAAAVQACRALAEVARYQGWSPETVAEVEDHARSQAGHVAGMQPGCCQLVIERRTEGAPHEFIGDFGVVAIDPGRQVSLGIVLHPAWQGRGLATRATTQLLGELFGRGIHRVTARVDPRNTPSWRLLERLGFRREGYEVACFYDVFDEAWTDEYCYALLAREWR